MIETNICTTLELLTNGLAIAYNGLFLECVPPRRSCLIGTVLTRKGELVNRDTRRDNWEDIMTPNVYLFYDNDTHTTFLVDKTIERIREIQPSGRILDATNKIIYEIQDDTWVPVVDLGIDPQIPTIIRSSIITRPINGTTATVDLIGRNPTLDPLSQLQNVVILGNSATISPLPEEDLTVLLYDSIIDGQPIRVALFISFRDPELDINSIFRLVPRFSAQGGRINVSSPVSTGAITVIIGGITVNIPVPLLTFTPTLNLNNLFTLGNITPNPQLVYPLTLWNEIYDLPVDRFDPISGIYLVPRSGEYNIAATINYAFSEVINLGLVTAINDLGIITAVAGRTFVPFFALLINGIIRAIAPVIAQRINLEDILVQLLAPESNGILPIIGDIGGILNGADAAIGLLPDLIDFEVFDINEIGQANFNLALRLNPGDTIRIVFIDDPTLIEVDVGSTVPLLALGPAGLLAGNPILPDSTFNAHWIGP